MKKWIVQYSAGITGTDVAEDIMADTENEAIQYFLEDAHNHAEEMQELYGGHDDDEDWEYDGAELDIWAEEYYPEKHDGLMSGGGNWEFRKSV